MTNTTNQKDSSAKAMADTVQRLQGEPAARMAKLSQDSSAASGLIAAQEFLKWNRMQKEPPVVIPKELGVFRKAMQIAEACRTQAPQAATQSLDGQVDEQALSAGWRDKLRWSKANTDYHGYIAFTPAQLQHFVSMLTLQAAPEAPAFDPMLDECAANMNGHRFGPHGINGERQCEWCAAAPAVAPEAPARRATW